MIASAILGAWLFTYFYKQFLYAKLYVKQHELKSFCCQNGSYLYGYVFTAQ